MKPSITPPAMAINRGSIPSNCLIAKHISITPIAAIANAPPVANRGPALVISVTLVAVSSTIFKSPAIMAPAISITPGSTPSIILNPIHIPITANAMLFIALDADSMASNDAGLVCAIDPIFAWNN